MPSHNNKKWFSRNDSKNLVSSSVADCVKNVVKNAKMKINEKNVASFAKSNAPIDKEGFLLKRGDINKQFQQRYFILKGNLLFYFEKQSDKEPLGVIIIEGCSVELADHENGFAFQLVFHGAGLRNYILAADDQDSMESWMKAITCASYDYMKMIVSELQRQLDSISSDENRPSISGEVTYDEKSPAKSTSSWYDESNTTGQRRDPDAAQAVSSPDALSKIDFGTACATASEIASVVMKRTQPAGNPSACPPGSKTFSKLHELHGQRIRPNVKAVIDNKNSLI